MSPRSSSICAMIACSSSRGMLCFSAFSRAEVSSITRVWTMSRNGCCDVAMCNCSAGPADAAGSRTRMGRMLRCGPSKRLTMPWASRILRVSRMELRDTRKIAARSLSVGSR